MFTKKKIVAGILIGSIRKTITSEICEFQNLNRYRKSIIRDITSQKNRIEKFLQSSGFRISSFVSDIFDASGRNIIWLNMGKLIKLPWVPVLKPKPEIELTKFLCLSMELFQSIKDHPSKFW